MAATIRRPMSEAASQAQRGGHGGDRRGGEATEEDAPVTVQVAELAEQRQSHRGEQHRRRDDPGDGGLADANSEAIEVSEMVRMVIGKLVAKTPVSAAISTQVG